MVEKKILIMLTIQRRMVIRKVEHTISFFGITIHFMVFVFAATANYIPVNYGCPINISNRIRDIYLWLYTRLIGATLVQPLLLLFMCVDFLQYEMARAPPQGIRKCIGLFYGYKFLDLVDYQNFKWHHKPRISPVLHTLDVTFLSHNMHMFMGMGVCHIVVQNNSILMLSSNRYSVESHLLS